jgi:hypothetical protein
MDRQNNIIMLKFLLKHVSVLQDSVVNNPEKLIYKISHINALHLVYDFVNNFGEPLIDKNEFKLMCYAKANDLLYQVNFELSKLKMKKNNNDLQIHYKEVLCKLKTTLEKTIIVIDKYNKNTSKPLVDNSDIESLSDISYDGDSSSDYEDDNDISSISRSHLAKKSVKPKKAVYKKSNLNREIVNAYKSKNRKRNVRK